jgi:hypothetical protein
LLRFAGSTDLLQTYKADAHGADPANAGPQAQFVVTGRVTDAVTDTPLAGANVEWTGLAEAWGDRGHGVVTKTDGSYEVVISGLGGPGSEQGQVNIRAMKSGYVEKAMKVTLSPVTTINFALSRPQ